MHAERALSYLSPRVRNESPRRELASPDGNQNFLPYNTPKTFDISIKMANTTETAIDLKNVKIKFYKHREVGK